MTAPKRKKIPLKVKLEACLHMLGLDPDDVEWDHDPALGVRPINEDGTDYDPPQHDPRYITPRSRENHAEKTNGTKATTAGSDKNRIAKVNRILGKTKQGQPKRAWPKGRKIQSRPFPKAEVRGRL